MSYTLALGPFHPHLRGPQRLVFRIDAEHVVDVEYRDGFNERGSAERLPRLDLPQALHLVGRICGTCSVAHQMAFCQALEQLAGVAIPPRAAGLRMAVAELERATSHLHSLGELLNIQGMSERSRQLFQHQDATQQAQKLLTGARLAPEMLTPGGVRRDVPYRDRETLLTALPALHRALYQLADRLIEQRSVLRQMVDTGILARTAAEQFGVRGPLARAAGIQRDTRADMPYASYGQYDVQAVVQEGGDVYARFVVLLLEAIESVRLAELALSDLPAGDYQTDFPTAIPKGHGVGVVEAPRGLLRYLVDADGQRITQVRIDAPRQLDRLLARTLFAGAEVDMIVPILVSCDLCTACAER